MGEDIHIRTSVWSKVENRYVNALGLSTCPQYSAFKPFFDGRYYEFFSLFGSSRGYFNPLRGGNFGIPDYLEETYKQHLKKSQYYGYVWYDADELQKEFLRYSDLLEDPLKYYSESEEDEDYIQRIKDGSFDFNSWKEETDPLISTIDDCVKNIDYMLSDSDYKEVFDVKRIRFLIYFDC